MSKKTNKDVVLEYVEAFNQGNTEALRHLFTDDALVYGVLGWGGLDKVIPIWQELHAAFSTHLQVESIIAESDIVAVRYIERGKSVGPFREQPATGQSYEIVAMEWFVIKEGQIARRWGRATQRHSTVKWGSCLVKR
jgi:steroid delta-isomerase-like uncharacterized protein